LLVFIGALLCFPASLALWEQRTLAKEEPFVELGRDMIDEEPVQAAIARAVVEQVRRISAVRQIEQSSKLSLDTIAQGAVTTLVQSDEDDIALRGVYHTTRALADLDKDTVQRDGDDLIVDLRPTIRHVVDGLAADAPALRGLELPEGMGIISVANGKNVGIALDTWRAVDKAAPVLIVLPLIAFVVAVVVAPSRGFTLFVIGAGIAGGAAVRIFLLQGPLDSLLEDLITGDSVYGEAGFAVYSRIVASYARQEVIVLIGGVVVAVVGFAMSVGMAARG
jgi:hypothetical protein